jgi:hypothetical protein
MDIDLMEQADVVQEHANMLLQKKHRASSLSHENEYYAKLSLVTKRFFPSRYPAPLASLLLRYWQTVWRGEFSAKKNSS